MTDREAGAEPGAVREVIAFHRALEAWLSGRAPNTDAAFADIDTHLAPDFSYVYPSGKVETRAPVVRGLRAAHGALGPEFRIRIERAVALAVGADPCVVRYEEWQRTPAGVTGRLSTAVFRPNPVLANGVEWVSVHETWLPPEHVTAGAGALTP